MMVLFCERQNLLPTAITARIIHKDDFEVTILQCMAYAADQFFKGLF